MQKNYISINSKWKADIWTTTAILINYQLLFFTEFIIVNCAEEHRDAGRWAAWSKIEKSDTVEKSVTVEKSTVE